MNRAMFGHNDRLLQMMFTASDILNGLLSKIPQGATSKIFRNINDQKYGQCILELYQINRKYDFYLYHTLGGNGQYIKLEPYKSELADFIERNQSIMADMVNELINIETNRMK
jgi:hypothetical protein